MKKSIALNALIIISLSLIINGCTQKPTEKINQPVPLVTVTEKTKEIISFSNARGDLIEPDPVENQCQKIFENYITGKQFKEKYSVCKLIESKVGWIKTHDQSECPNGFSPQGCYICELECTLLEPLIINHNDLQYEMKDHVDYRKNCQEDYKQEEPFISITTINDSVKFNQIFKTYCNVNKNLTLQYDKTSNYLIVNEIFDADYVTKCICPIEITGTIHNLEKGNHKIQFIFDNKYTNQKTILDTLEFKIE